MARVDAGAGVARSLLSRPWRASTVVTAALIQFATLSAFAAGTPAGTVIENRAEVAFDIGGDRLTIASNTARLTVEERIDVVTIALTDQVAAAPGSAGNVLVFSVTNTGNGQEAFRLSIDNAIAGDDFDPQEAVPSIYFDADGSGDLTVADTAYAPGTNDPLLDPDQSITVLVVNDLTGGLAEGALGRSALAAESLSGTGAPGTVVIAGGPGTLASVLGSSGGRDAATAEYVATSVALSVVKSVTVSDPFGGDRPLPGAILAYRIDVTVTGANDAGNAVVTDPLPANTTFRAGSLSVNGSPLTDAVDGDAGEVDPSGTAIVVRLGDLTAADGVQSVAFEVTID